jgi:hypothetical protein
MIAQDPCWTRVLSVSGRKATPPTSVGFMARAVLRFARGARQKPPSSLTRNTGSPTDVFNDKGQQCPFQAKTGLDSITGFRTRYCGSANGVGDCSPTGVPPHPPSPSSGPPCGSQRTTPLVRGGTSRRRLRNCLLQAHPPCPQCLAPQNCGDCGGR